MEDWEEVEGAGEGLVGTGEGIREVFIWGVSGGGGVRENPNRGTNISYTQRKRGGGGGADLAPLQSEG